MDHHPKLVISNCLRKCLRTQRSWRRRRMLITVCLEKFLKLYLFFLFSFMSPNFIPAETNKQIYKQKKIKKSSVSGNRILLTNWNRIITWDAVCIIYAVVLERQKSRPHLCQRDFKNWNGILIIRRSILWAFPGSSDGKESACNVGDRDSIGWGGSPGEESGYPLRYSCLENSMDRGAWRATYCGISESVMTEWLTHMLWVVSEVSRVRLFVTPWTVAY